MCIQHGNIFGDAFLPCLCFFSGGNTIEYCVTIGAVKLSEKNLGFRVLIQRRLKVLRHSDAALRLIRAVSSPIGFGGLHFL